MDLLSHGHEENQKKSKHKSRIPGVDVGEVVDTSLGPKKKVCFNIGGR